MLRFVWKFATGAVRLAVIAAVAYGLWSWRGSPDFLFVMFGRDGWYPAVVNGAIAGVAGLVVLQVDSLAENLAEMAWNRINARHQAHS